MFATRLVKLLALLSFCLFTPLFLWGQETFRINISFLADSVGCRYPSSPGDSLTQAHIVKECSSFGLETIEQPFDITESIWGKGSLRVQNTVGTKEFVHGRDFVVSARSASDTLSLCYVVVRGMPPKEKLSLFRNKIVIVLPNYSQHHGTNRTLPLSDLTDAGVRAIFYALPPGRTLVRSVSRGNRNRVPFPIPVISIRDDVLHHLIPSSLANTLVDDVYIAPSSEVLFLATKHFERNIKTKNIIAIKQGVGERAFVVGAHYDTLAPEPDTNIARPGANDNASGIAMLLALAERFRTMSTRHSILFVAFGGEEKGALGSQHFIDHPSINLDTIDEMINIDMVGRLENDTLYYSQFNHVLLCPSEITPVSIHLCEGEDSMSDHYDFVREGISTCFFHTGKDSKIHSTEDTSDRINYEGMLKILDFLTSYILTIDSL